MPRVVWEQEDRREFTPLSVCLAGVLFPSTTIFAVWCIVHSLIFANLSIISI